MFERGGLAVHFGEPNYLLDTIKALRGLGLEKIEVYTPYPVHGVEEALHLSRSGIPWIGFIFGFIGCVTALLLQWWTSAVDYKINVGGKPLFSGPAFIPIMFELTVLFTAFATLGALFYFCKLPRFASIFEKDEKSHRATNDEFMLVVDGSDPCFKENEIQEVFKKFHGFNARWVGEK